MVRVGREGEISFIPLTVYLSVQASIGPWLEPCNNVVACWEGSEHPQLRKGLEGRGKRLQELKREAAEASRGVVGSFTSTAEEELCRLEMMYLSRSSRTT